MQDKYPDRTPKTRIFLIICAVLLAILALSGFNLLMLIPSGIWLDTMIRGGRRITLFGDQLAYESASEPRSSNDPQVRASFVIGIALLILGFIRYFGIYTGLWGISLFTFLPYWLLAPGVNEILMGIALICVGLDLLSGGLANVKTLDKSGETKTPAIPASIVIGRYATPWLIVTGLAHFGQWHGVVQFVVMLSGLALLLFAAKSWPLFAIAGAFAGPYYLWSTFGNSSSGSIPKLASLFVLFGYLGIPAIVLGILGRAASGLIDSFILRKQETAPLFLQAGLGFLACVLAISGYKHHVELKAKRKENIEAAHAKEIAAYSEENKKSQEEKNLEAQMQREKVQALTPGISCQFEGEGSNSSVLFTKQYPHPSPELAGPSEGRGFNLNAYGENSIREVALLDLKANHQAISQYADIAPILRLPSGAVVFMTPGKSDLFLRDVDERIFHLTTFKTSLLQHKPVACFSTDGTYWVVAFGPVVSLFDQLSTDAPIREVFQRRMDHMVHWFR